MTVSFAPPAGIRDLRQTDLRAFSPPPAPPTLEELKARSDMEWGIPPSYNEEYRRIRWPKPEGGVPYWKTKIRNDFALKERHAWHNIKKKQFGVRMTHRAVSLYNDLIFCMNENIPLKTKSLEYVPKDTSVYVKGIKVMKFNVEKGVVDRFTFSGVYDKLISLVLRNFGIHVKLYKKGLIWTNSIEGTIGIDLDEEYELTDTFYIGFINLRYTSIRSKQYLTNVHRNSRSIWTGRERGTI